MGAFFSTALCFHRSSPQEESIDSSTQADGFSQADGSSVSPTARLDGQESAQMRGPTPQHHDSDVALNRMSLPDAQTQTDELLETPSEEDDGAADQNKAISLLKRLFPETVNNDYKGSKIALYAFFPLTAVTLWRSQHHIFSPDGGAQSIATIPLNTFSKQASDTVVSTFALWGISQLSVAFIDTLVAARYKSLIPAMYLATIFEYGMRLGYVAQYKPIKTVEVPPGAKMNAPMLVVLSVLFALSLKPQNSSDNKENNQGDSEREPGRDSGVQ